MKVPFGDAVLRVLADHPGDTLKDQAKTVSSWSELASYAFSEPRVARALFMARFDRTKDMEEIAWEEIGA